eukprot:485014-Pleurochrysis_carterae.AAC.1
MRDEPGGISMTTLEKAQELAQEAVGSRLPATIHLSMITAKQTLKLRLDAAAGKNLPPNDPTNKRQRTFK